jgi:hypothetical protein
LRAREKWLNASSREEAKHADEVAGLNCLESSIEICAAHWADFFHEFEDGPVEPDDLLFC